MRSSSSLAFVPRGVTSAVEILAGIEEGASIKRSLEPAGVEGPRLGFGAVHEWFDGGGRNGWLPPLGVLIGLAWNGVEGGVGRVAWIGRRCWAYPHALLRRDPADPGGDRRLLARSVFVDPPGRAELVWAVDLALRCEGVGVVVADGAGVTMAESRRFQLAAGAGGAIGLLARPARDIGELSAAKTRWMVTPRVSEGGERAWTLELLRCKGLRPSIGSARRWVVRRDHATGEIGEWTACDVCVAADVVGRPVASAESKIA